MTETKKLAIICTDSTLTGADKEREQVEIDKILSDLDGHGYEVKYLDRTETDEAMELLDSNKSPETVGSKAVQFICGHSDSIPQIYHDAIIETAEKAADAGFHVITPGSNNGLMLSVAKAALDKGHEVTGVSSLPIAFEEPPYNQLTNIIFAATESDRNDWYKRLADVFIAGAGSLGTISEVLDCAGKDYVDCFWRKPKSDDLTGDNLLFTPIMILNTPTELYPDGYFEPLKDLLERTIEVNAGPVYVRNMLHFAATPDELIEEMKSRTDPKVNRQLFAEMNTHVDWVDGKLVEVEGKTVAYAPTPPDSANRKPANDVGDDVELSGQLDDRQRVRTTTN